MFGRFVSIMVLIMAAIPLKAAEDLSSSIYSVDVPEGTLNMVQEVLAESINRSQTAFVSEATSPDIHLLEEAEVSITFLMEGAGYKNTFGYFTYDDDLNILSEQVIFNNSSATGSGGTLNQGDTVDLGTFEAGTNIGFWVTANGYNNPDGHTYYSIDSLNPDGERHIAVVGDPANEQVVIGFEDLYGLGDRDYNDVVFTYTATPWEAIDLSQIPAGAPEPSENAILFMTGVLAVIYMYRQRRRVRLQQLLTPKLAYA